MQKMKIDECLPPFKILIVEDDSLNQTVIGWMLKKMGYLSTIADHGKIAIDYFLNGEEFHLILMDLRMPVLDGFKTTQAIREIEHKNNRNPIPIVALTADALHGVAEKCAAVGMNEFLTKPVAYESLEAVLNRWLPLPSGELDV